MKTQVYFIVCVWLIACNYTNHTKQKRKVVVAVVWWGGGCGGFLSMAKGSKYFQISLTNEFVLSIVKSSVRFMPR